MKRYFFIIAAAILAAGGLFVLNRPSEPASPFTGREKQALLFRMLNRDPVLEERAANNQWVTYRDRYLKFLYPQSAAIVTASPGGQVLSRFQYRTEPHIQVNIQLSQTAGLQGLREYPGVAIRLKQPDLYQASASRSGTVESFVFTKQSEGVEKTFFSLKDDMVLILSVSGNSLEAVDAAFGPVYSSLALEEP